MDLWERVSANLKLDRLPWLSANEQTKFSWAKQVECLEDVPEIFKGAFEYLVDEGGALPYAVLTPRFEGFIRRENQKLVYILDHKVSILEDAKEGLLETCYDLWDIHYLEVGRILLKAWIKIVGVAADRLQVSSKLKFNTVTAYMFAPIIENIRTNGVGSYQADVSLGTGVLDNLGQENFKLKNFAREGLLPGEQVIEVLLQPEVKRNLFSISGRSLYRGTSPAHVSILTDRELILIRDGDGGRWGRGDRRGGVWNYIPLGRIASVSISTRPDDLLVNSISLAGGDQIHTVHSPAFRVELERFVDKVEDELRRARS